MASQYNSSALSLRELNARALDHFIYTPVDSNMISYLAKAAREVIYCDENMRPASPTSETQTSQPIKATDEAPLPTLEELIRNVVEMSNVQVPTLMSTLVYLNRLKSRLQPEARGLRCTCHRIFMAALILTAKYLNDSSPKNKHWSNYTKILKYNYPGGWHGFSKTEVNLMEKQLLFLLNWELRITEEDLHRELDPFLAPFRAEVAAKHERRMRRKAAQEEERRRREEMEMWEQQQMAVEWMAAQEAHASSLAPTGAYATPPMTPAQRRARSRSSSRLRSVRQATPDSLPPLSSSYGSSISSLQSYPPSSRASSRASGATTPPSIDGSDPYIYYDGYPLEPPMDIVTGEPMRPQLRKQKSLLPYEISVEDLQTMEQGGRYKKVKGMFGRIFSSGSSGVSTR